MFDKGFFNPNGLVLPRYCGKQAGYSGVIAGSARDEAISIKDHFGCTRDDTMINNLLSAI